MNWSLLFSALALFISFAAYIRSGKALRETSLLNAPNLIFSCRAIQDPASIMRVVIRTALLNSGGHSTEITEGGIMFQSNEGPNADQTRNLTGQKIGGGREHIEEFGAKSSIINSQREGISAAQVICKARYSRPDQSDGYIEEKHVYNVEERQFFRAP
jgi:hypothetical protein